jgi:hypothetical protein
VGGPSGVEVAILNKWVVGVTLDMIICVGWFVEVELEMITNGEYVKVGEISRVGVLEIVCVDKKVIVEIRVPA